MLITVHTGTKKLGYAIRGVPYVSCSRIFQSRIFHPCSLMPIIQVSHFQRPSLIIHWIQVCAVWWSEIRSNEVRRFLLWQFNDVLGAMIREGGATANGKPEYGRPKKNTGWIMADVKNADQEI